MTTHIICVPAPKSYEYFDIESLYHQYMIDYLLINIENKRFSLRDICTHSSLDVHSAYQKSVIARMKIFTELPHVYIPAGCFYINGHGLCLIYSTETLTSTFLDALALYQTFDIPRFKNYIIKYSNIELSRCIF